MPISVAILKYISDKAKCDITTPQGAAYLRDDIQSVTGQSLSLNTIKRLTGVLPYESQPRPVTLDILAQYVGCKSWLQLTELVSQTVSSFESDQRFIDMSTLPDDAIVEIAWSPGRRILLKHIAGARYKVIEAENSRLSIGDVLKLSQLAIGFPLLVQEVTRDSSNLGSYTAAARLGISRLNLL